MSTDIRSYISLGDKGHTICVLPDISCDQLKDDLDLNKSFPGTQTPSYSKGFVALRRRDYPDFITGKIYLYICQLDKSGCLKST